MSTGQQIAASILPFAFSKHTLSKDEFLDIVAKAIDREIEDRDAKINSCIAFMKGEAVTIKGLTYRNSINPYSFIELISK